MNGGSINTYKHGDGFYVKSKCNIILTDVTNVKGYDSMYFKSGAAGSSVTATRCNFDARNNYGNDGDNDFGAFVFEGTGISVDLIDCSVDITNEGSGTATSYLVVTQYEKSTTEYEPTQNGTKFTVSGSKTKIKGKLVSQEDDNTNKNTIKMTDGLYTDNPEGYVDSTKYKVVELKAGDDGYSDGYRYKVVEKGSSN